ncbi:hypothetical protein V2J09_016307 [Rumex salicifolius]
MDAGRSPRNVNLFMAKLAEEANRYDDMIYSRRSFGKVTLPRQCAWLIFNAAEKKSENNYSDAGLIVGIKVYKEKIASELSSAFDCILALLESKIIPSAVTDGEKVLYNAIKRDFNSCLADIKTGPNCTVAIDQALHVYKISQVCDLTPPLDFNAHCLLIFAPNRISPGSSNGIL